MTTVQKLSGGQLRDALAGWITTLTITAFAFVLRLTDVSYPPTLVFDETYYPKDAYSMLRFGYERAWPDPKLADPQIVAGTPDIMMNTPGFAVHPPMGKWMIAIGEHLFGMNSFGWRIMSVVFGTLLVFLTIRLARRLSRSTLVGGIAGVLLTFDGLAFTMSRIGLLDIFQATFTLAAVSCVVADRDWFKLRLARYLLDHNLPDLGGGYGPLVVWRPWRLLAGIMFGCAVATKWGSLYPLAVFGVLSVIWDINARFMAGASRKAWKAVLIDAPIAFGYLVILALATYVASYSGWLASSNAYERQWGATHPNSPLVKAIGKPLASLWQYHVSMWGWHTGDSIKAATHPYASHPATWMVMLRPVGMFAENDIPDGSQGCVAPGSTCLRVITASGTPLLWWLCAAALVLAIARCLSGGDRRFVTPVVATLSLWLPWFMHADRPIFYFYSVVFVPFTVICLSMLLGEALGPASGRNRRTASIVVGTIVSLVILNFAFIYPILTGQLMTRQSWLYRMWFGNWI